MPSRKQLANAIRILAIDAVEKAQSGHPGMPMGMADIAEVLYNDFLIHNPSNPKWPNRDRFILSNGHGSLLQYALLYLTGYPISLSDIKQFRQLDSITPGHPEYGDTPGIETTTGPLGQGLANAVGMAIVERTLANQFNRENYKIIDHHTYVFAGDGCLMEGISHETCSLAGTLGLGKLILFYDDNGVSIDGKVEPWFTDDTPSRFEAYGWHVIPDINGHNPKAIKTALSCARTVTDKPSILCCKTIIGYGAPNLSGSHETHGAPLGKAEIAATRAHLGWKYPPFVMPEEIQSAWNGVEKGHAQQQAWETLYQAYQTQYPELAGELMRRLNSELPDHWEKLSSAFILETLQKKADLATRKASQNCLEAFGPILPELMGGSADLANSNNTFWSGSVPISQTVLDGNYIYYGVREFAMSAIMNGIALHQGIIPYGGTFLVFCDYARNAVRLSAMMKQRVIFVYTHDSIGLGEDGPTHQPIEHIAMLRMTPDLTVWRPCDTVETAVAWKLAIEKKSGPTALLLSRQTLAFQQENGQVIHNIARGGYIIRNCQGEPEVILIATGSEVSLATAAYEILQASKRVRVVSMPSTDTFEAQAPSYKESVLPSKVTARVAVEAAITDYWYKYVGFNGIIIGLESFGRSAPYRDIYRTLDITVEKVVEAALQVVG